jgi:hypothetical protein
MVVQAESSEVQILCDVSVFLDFDCRPVVWTAHSFSEAGFVAILKREGRETDTITVNTDHWFGSQAG